MKDALTIPAYLSESSNSIVLYCSVFISKGPSLVSKYIILVIKMICSSNNLRLFLSRLFVSVTICFMDLCPTFVIVSVFQHLYMIFVYLVLYAMNFPLLHVGTSLWSEWRGLGARLVFSCQYGFVTSLFSTGKINIQAFLLRCCVLFIVRCMIGNHWRWVNQQPWLMRD